MRLNCGPDEPNEWEEDDEDAAFWPERQLRALPDGPYIRRLVSLSLCGNRFGTVPPVLAAATALESLDLSSQRMHYENVHYGYDSERHVHVQGLNVLGRLTRLRRVDLTGFSKEDSSVRALQGAHPNVTVI